MQGKPVHGCVQKTSIISLGQAPGIHEERFGKPFAYTAGKTLFKWLAMAGIEEEDFRARVNMSAVCRCFPGKAKNGDRKPDRQEVENCIPYMEFELKYHRPELVIPIGKLAIDQILERAILISEGSHSSKKNDTDGGIQKTDEKDSRASKGRKKATDSKVRNQELTEGAPPAAVVGKAGQSIKKIAQLQAYLNSKGRASYKLDQIIGRRFRSDWAGISFDWIALPHPSGLNVWNHTETGKICISNAIAQIRKHNAVRNTFPR